MYIGCAEYRRLTVLVELTFLTILECRFSTIGDLRTLYIVRGLMNPKVIPYASDCLLPKIPVLQGYIVETWAPILVRGLGPRNFSFLRELPGQPPSLVWKTGLVQGSLWITNQSSWSRHLILQDTSRGAGLTFYQYCQDLGDFWPQDNNEAAGRLARTNDVLAR